MGTGLWVHVSQHTADTSQLHSTHSDAHNTPENTIALGDDEQKVQCTIAQGLPLKVIVDLADLHASTHACTHTHTVIKYPKVAPQIYNAVISQIQAKIRYIRSTLTNRFTF